MSLRIQRAGLIASSGAAAWTPALLDNVITWGETRSASNTITSDEYETLADLSTSGKPLGSASSTVRPARVLDDMLSGGAVAEFDGVDEWLRNTSTACPKTVVVVYQQVVWTSAEALISYGASNRPQLRQAGVSNRVDFLAASSPVSQPAVTFTERYYRCVIGEDDGSTSQTCTIYDPSFTVVEGTDTDANVNARSADGGVFSLCAFVAGTFPTNARIAFVLATTDVLTPAEKTSLLDYLRREIVDVQPLPAMTFVGTRTTRADAQPRPYPIEHEGQSGNTVAGCASRLVGFWGGSGGTTIGSGDDPGAGNRGAMETLATTRSEANMVCVVHIGTNDASSGAIDSTTYERFIRRLWAVAGVGPGNIAAIILCSIVGRTDGAGVPQGRLNTFNSTSLPTIIGNLTGASIPVTLCDLAAAFNTGTMLGSDGLHPNKLGAQTIAQTIYDTLVVEDLVSPNNRLVLIGDSITEGGTAFVQATAQYRPWLAKLLAAA